MLASSLHGHFLTHPQRAAQPHRALTPLRALLDLLRPDRALTTPRVNGQWSMVPSGPNGVGRPRGLTPNTHSCTHGGGTGEGRSVERLDTPAMPWTQADGIWAFISTAR
jgi:hypothetical protein